MKKLTLALAAMMLLFAGAANAGELNDRSIRWTVVQFLQQTGAQVKEIRLVGTQTFPQGTAADLELKAVMPCSFGCFGQTYKMYEGDAQALFKKYDNGTVVISALRVGGSSWSNINTPVFQPK